jgi:hypothetical protein
MPLTVCVEVPPRDREVLRLAEPGGLRRRRAWPAAGIDLGLVTQPRSVSGLIPSYSPNRRHAPGRDAGS